MMRRALLLLYLSACWAAEAHADPHPVVLIKCQKGDEITSQTGFLLRDLPGIVTALHGVLDCDGRTVQVEGAPQLSPPDVRLAKVDIARDLAVLTSVPVEALAGTGLTRKTAGSFPRTARVEGYPLGLRHRLATRLQLRSTTLVPLRDLLPGRPLVELKGRASPSVDIHVLSLEGHLTVGHSGAPILDSQGRVFAVANGGLERGATEITWGVPLPPAAAWRDVSDQREELLKLSLKPSAGLFASAALFEEYTSVECFGRVLVPARVSSLGELIESVDDPLTYEQLMQIYGLHGVPASFVLYRDRDALEVTLAVPRGWRLAGSADECRAVDSNRGIEVRFFLDPVAEEDPLRHATRLLEEREREEFCERGYSVDPRLSNLASRALVGRNIIHHRKTYARVDRRCARMGMGVVPRESPAWMRLKEPELTAEGSFQCTPVCLGGVPYPDAWMMQMDPSPYVSAWGFAGYVTSGRLLLTSVIHLEDESFAGRLAGCVRRFSVSADCARLYEKQRAWAIGVMAATASTLIPVAPTN